MCGFCGLSAPLSKPARVGRVNLLLFVPGAVLPFQTHPGDDPVGASFLPLGDDECVACHRAAPWFLFGTAVSEVLCKCNA